MSHHEQLLSLCKEYNALLIDEDAQCVRIAVQHQPSAQIVEALRFASDKRIDIEFWSAQRLEKLRQQTNTLGVATQTTDLSIISQLNNILQQAIQLRASDIHFEPTEQNYQIRLRIDGVLQLLSAMPGSLAPAITARLKVLGNLDIAERRLPQDGQMDITLGERKVSFRLSTLPVRYGEKVVLRILQQVEQPLDLGQSGMATKQQEQFHSALKQPQGMILVTGPTGSGKTITLYSALTLLNQPTLNVCSVEDPIEIPLAGLNQTQINTKSGLTFQEVLRALLRQDPDVVMVGEIRDSETAEIAIKAAQTGHLVLSTLHTNSTVEAIIRLEQMGIARWMLASAINMVVAQRLVRKLCSHCKSKHTQPWTLPVSIWPRQLPRWNSPGCERCYAGFYGRTALYEILPVDPTLREAIMTNLSANQITQLACQRGMTTLFACGCQAVEQGITSLEEVYRVLGVPNG